MSSSFSNLKFELIGTGEQSGSWGTTTNSNIGTAIEEAIVGMDTVNFATDANKTITLTDTTASQSARNFALNLTSSGSLTATRTLFVPAIEKPYLVINNTTGGQSITISNSSGCKQHLAERLKNFYNSSRCILCKYSDRLQCSRYILLRSSMPSTWSRSCL